MRRISVCRFDSIGDLFNFGKYNGLSLADVLDINPSYISWCVKHCTGVICQLEDIVIEEIKIAYPDFIMDNFFESRRTYNLYQDIYDEPDDMDDYDDIDEFDPFLEETPSYGRYSGSWAQEEAGYSDDEIDTIFDGDPSAYWNID